MTKVGRHIQAVAIVLMFGLASACAAREPAEPINLSQLTLDLRAALKAEALSRDSADHAAAVVDLCDLCAAMRLDDRYAANQVLQGLAARARRRLIDVREMIRLSLKRDGIERPPAFDQNLEQLERLSASASQETTDEFPAATGGGFGPAGDNGFMLIELITRTVSPDFWNTQGGPGVVHYFGLQRALVVRGTTRVHEDIQSLLQALRGLPR